MRASCQTPLVFFQQCTALECVDAATTPAVPILSAFIPLFWGPSTNNPPSVIVGIRPCPPRQARFYSPIRSSQARNAPSIHRTKQQCTGGSPKLCCRNGGFPGHQPQRTAEVPERTQPCALVIEGQGQRCRALPAAIQPRCRASLPLPIDDDLFFKLDFQIGCLYSF